MWSKQESFGRKSLRKPKKSQSRNRTGVWHCRTEVAQWDQRSNCHTAVGFLVMSVPQWPHSGFRVPTAVTELRNLCQTFWLINIHLSFRESQLYKVKVEASTFSLAWPATKNHSRCFPIKTRRLRCKDIKNKIKDSPKKPPKDVLKLFRFITSKLLSKKKKIPKPYLKTFSRIIKLKTQFYFLVYTPSHVQVLHQASKYHPPVAWRSEEGRRCPKLSWDISFLQVKHFNSPTLRYHSVILQCCSVTHTKNNNFSNAVCLLFNSWLRSKTYWIHF